MISFTLRNFCLSSLRPSSEGAGLMAIAPTPVKSIASDFFDFQYFKTIYTFSQQIFFSNGGRSITVHTFNQGYVTQKKAYVGSSLRQYGDQLKSKKS